MSERIFEGIVFVLGGCAYGLLEILFRGYTHWTMVITGGACILTMYHIQGVLMDLPLIAAATAGALIVTAYEFTVGLIVNVKLGWAYGIILPYPLTYWARSARSTQWCGFCSA